MHEQQCIFELGLHDDCVDDQWVSEVQQWAEGDILTFYYNFNHWQVTYSESADLRRLQEEIEGLTVSIKRRTQRLYSQTGKTKSLRNLLFLNYYSVSHSLLRLW